MDRKKKETTTTTKKNTTEQYKTRLTLEPRLGHPSKMKNKRNEKNLFIATNC